MISRLWQVEYSSSKELISSASHSIKEITHTFSILYKADLKILALKWLVEFIYSPLDLVCFQHLSIFQIQFWISPPPQKKKSKNWDERGKYCIKRVSQRKRTRRVGCENWWPKRDPSSPQKKKKKKKWSGPCVTIHPFSSVQGTLLLPSVRPPSFFFFPMYDIFSSSAPKLLVYFISSPISWGCDGRYTPASEKRRTDRKR